MPYSVSQRTIKDLTEDPCIDIPDHQRPYIWNDKLGSNFIDTIMQGLPTQNIIVYQEVLNGRLKKWIEDGQQRYMTVKQFINGELPNVKYQGKSYIELPEAYKTQIKTYQFTVCTMEDVPYETRVELFQRLQDGVKLTDGQRFNTSGAMPIVQLAKRIQDDERIEEIWGKQPENKSFSKLANYVAIAAGLNLGSDDHITSSYAVLKDELKTPINEMLVNERLDKLFDVYKRAQEECAITSKKKITEFPVGKYTGYILYNMRQADCDWEEDSQLWVDYIAECRRDPSQYWTIMFQKPASRNWTSERWSIGLNNVRNPDRVPANYYLNGVENDSSE